MLPVLTSLLKLKLGGSNDTARSKDFSETLSRENGIEAT